VTYSGQNRDRLGTGRHVAASGDDTWQVRTGHVAASERDTCQADLALLAGEWTNKKVTRVTTHRVTRGTLTSPSDVADTWQC
jgi:hypothetical protein